MTDRDPVVATFAATTFFAGPASLAGPASTRLTADAMLTSEGNRWSAPGEPTIYLASDLGVALAEFGRHAPPDPEVGLVWSVQFEREGGMDHRHCTRWNSGASADVVPSMIQLRLRFPLAFVALVAIVAACSVPGGGGSPAPSGTASPGAISYPTGASDLVIRLRYVGGFAPATAHLLDVPVVSVHGDGTAIVPGPVPAIYPGPLLPNLQRATITPAGMQVLLEAARAAGLFGPDAHYDVDGIMDASSSEFTVNADGQMHTISAYALFENGGREPQQPGADPAVMEARAKLLIFQNQLTNLEALLGDEIGDATPYVADALQLLIFDGAPVDEGALGQEPIAWPLETPLATLGAPIPALVEGQRCAVIEGGDVPSLLPLMARANTLTPWTDGDAVFGLAVRPLLPGEAGCPGGVQ